MIDIFKMIRRGRARMAREREERKTRATYYVRSAESPNGGADIPGAAEDARRIVEAIRTGKRYKVP